MLADVIDYDELVHGQRREGIFVVLDVNIVQLMDIVAGVIPGLLLSALGYVGNGGCACGCGAKCPAPYLRWSCPGDIGYACSDNLARSNFPFYGEPTRASPCTSQSTDVQVALQAFFFYVPAACFVVATFFAHRAPINDEMQLRVREQLQRRHDGHAKLYNPLERTTIEQEEYKMSEADRIISNVIDSFSEAEQARHVMHVVEWPSRSDIRRLCFASSPGSSD